MIHESQEISAPPALLSAMIISQKCGTQMPQWDQWPVIETQNSPITGTLQ
jgi:hypothetical protein